MKHRALFSSKDKSKIKMSSAAILLGALRVNKGIQLLKIRTNSTKSIFFPLIVNSLLKRFRGLGTQSRGQNRWLPLK